MSYPQQQYPYPNGLPLTGQTTSKTTPYPIFMNNQQYPYPQYQYPYQQPAGSQYVQPSAPPMPQNMQYPYQQQPYQYTQSPYGTQYSNYPPPAYNSPYTQGLYPPITSTYKKK